MKKFRPTLELNYRVLSGGSLKRSFVEMVRTDHVIVSMDFELVNHNLNLIKPANILAWAMNCWQQLSDIPIPPTERLVHKTRGLCALALVA